MPFASFDAVDATSLRWLRRGDHPLDFALLAGDSPVAELVWKGSSGSLATATTASAAWTLKRIGFLDPGVTVRAEGTKGNVARLAAHWKSHRIDFEAGGSFRFHRAGLLVPAWQVADSQGAEVLHVEPVREGRKLVGGALVASAAATHRSEFPVLVALSWYFIVLAWFEDEALVPLEGSDATPKGSAPAT
jgi:hypothetical protein